MSLKDRIEKIRPYLPSKKLSLLIGGIAGVSIAVFFGTRIDFSVLATLFAREQREKVTLGGLVDLDTDGDGIKDWEEALWGTDPNNKDTDGDGIPDGAYIAERRRALNGDATLYVNDAGFPETPTGIGTSNQTENFSRELFSAVIALQQSGNLNDQSINSLLESFSYNIEDLKQKKTFSTSDITVVPTTDDTIGSYLSALDPAFENTPWKNDTTMETLAEALELENEESLTQIAVTRSAYEIFRDTLLNAPVPENAVITQLAILNPIQGIIENMQTMERAYEDPIPAIASINGYLSNLELLTRNLSGLSAYMESL